MNDFQKQVKQFIAKIIRIRIFLIRYNKSKINCPGFEEEIEKLNYYTNLYSSESRLAEMILLNNRFIIKIIPGRGSKIHDRLLREYYKIHEAASNIFHKICNESQSLVNT